MLQRWASGITDSERNSLSIVIQKLAAVSLVNAVNDVNDLPSAFIGGEYLHDSSKIIHFQSKLPAITEECREKWNRFCQKHSALIERGSLYYAATSSELKECKSECFLENNVWVSLSARTFFDYFAAHGCTQQIMEQLLWQIKLSYLNKSSTVSDFTMPGWSAITVYPSSVLSLSAQLTVTARYHLWGRWQ